MKKLNLGLIGILILGIVIISGCTTNGNSTSTPQYKSDIQLSTPTYTYYAGDGSGGGGCAVHNRGDVTYKKVVIGLEIYDKDGNVVGNQNITVGKIGPKESINWVHTTGKPIPTGVSASATVINATPA
jgi:hypothetical protein